MGWTGIKAEEYYKIKDVVRFYIAEALKINKVIEINYTYYENAILNREMQVWVLYTDNLTITGVMITKIGWFHDVKICSILITSGANINIWEEFYDAILENWCKENEVDRLEIRTRKGIGKVLTRHGYSVSEVICTKQLEY